MCLLLQLCSITVSLLLACRPLAPLKTNVSHSKTIFQRKPSQFILSFNLFKCHYGFILDTTVMESLWCDALFIEILHCRRNKSHTKTQANFHLKTFTEVYRIKYFSEFRVFHVFLRQPGRVEMCWLAQTLNRFMQVKVKRWSTKKPLTKLSLNICKNTQNTQESRVHKNIYILCMKYIYDKIKLKIPFT